ncbi:MAG: hypothetical protein NTW03_06225 [Verrucomicrobia bacterium]|nr:hypothetical protein [Verrucomicrobiota bacterium]
MSNDKRQHKHGSVAWQGRAQLRAYTQAVPAERRAAAKHFAQKVSAR